MEAQQIMFKRILCPIDFDGNSLEALRMARDLASREQASLYVLHVIPPTNPTVISAPLIAHRSEEDARTELREIAKKELGGVDHHTVLRGGHPAKEILSAEEEVEADLVVMATHGRTGVSHLVLGSVAEKVVRESACPVLTVRTKPVHDANRVSTIKQSAAV
jgi:universal stress protein A